MYRKGLPALRHSLRRRSLTGGGPRDDEPGGDVGRRRRCSLLQTPRSSSSSSEEEEEEEEEELIASKRSREMRRKHNAPSKQVEPSSSYDGIRRSTRQRKVIFENVSDSWIVGNRAVRGYPDYLRSPRHVRVTRRSLRAVRYTSANGLDEDDDEVEEPDDDVEVVEEEQTRSKTNGTVGTRSCRRILRMPAPRHRGQPPRIHQRVAGDGSGDDEDEGGNAEVDQREEEEEGGGSSGDEADGDHVPEAEDSFQDMYARVKRRRRAAAQQRRSPDSMSASENNSRGYSLRKTKPAVQRFQIAKPSNPFRGSSKKRRRRISTSSSSSSSSSSSTSDKRDRDRRDRRKKRRELVGKVPKQSKLTADTGPMTLDSSIRFSEIGGLQRHVNSLKEMILFPILYPDIFRKFGVTPPKGVLFHGPPGTGKTLMARALANECSQQGNRKVSFFMRKGADVLSKWVGESERQLRLLFEEAHQGRPSIIFFDELDGLAPVRSSKQDQIHSSIVCTLLALMDGLDNRGDIIIIGATNRIDSIDPALRRPGRFDRELHFPLPGVKERREILGIHAQWAEPDILNFMAERTAGYCGSDLRALCTESVIHSMQRVYPQIYHSTKKLLLQPEKVKVERIDFLHAFQEIVPSAKRHWLTLGRKMPTYLDPLLSETLATLLTHVGDVFPYAFNRTSASHQVRRSPRLLLVGDKTATSVLSTGLLYKFEHCSVLNVAFHTLYSEPGHTPEEVLKMVFKELPHQSGAILWFGDVSLWWNETSATVKATLESMLAHMDQSLPVLYLATSPTSSLAPEVKNLFSKKRKEVYLVPQPTKEQREAFFRPLFRIKALKAPPKPKPKREEMEILLEAPPTPPPQLTPEEMQARFREEENTLRELRIFLRQICAKLARNKQFYMFSKPVDVEEVPDYLSVIKEPMDLETMMTKIDHHKYTCAQDFLNDIDLMCANALEYNPDRNPADKQIRHRACYLQDTAYALIKAEMDSDFEDNCRKIRDDRKKLEVKTEATATVAPAVVKTEDMDVQSHDAKTVESSDAKISPGASTSGALSSSGLKRKRHNKSPWSKGFLGKKKKTPTNGSNPSASRASTENDVPDAGPAGQSTPQKNRSSNLSDAAGDGSHLDESRLLDNSLTMNGYITGATEDTEEETTGTPKVVKIDRPALNRLLEETVEVTATRNGHDQLTDLYGLMSEAINAYKFKWDRTNLIQELQKLLREFSAGETSSEDEGQSHTQQQPSPC